MSVITQLAGRIDEGVAPKTVDALELTSEERASAHFAATTESGRTVRLSLPRGTELQEGDVLLREGDHAVVVRAAAEELLWLRAGASALEWWAACYQLGNLHRPARFLRDGVLTPRDPMVHQMLAGLDVRVEAVTRPFVGRRFGAAGGRHHHDQPHHGHDHDGHTHGHAHGHGHPHG
jgi:urease accessory protein